MLAFGSDLRPLRVEAVAAEVALDVVVEAAVGIGPEGIGREIVGLAGVGLAGVGLVVESDAPGTAGAVELAAPDAAGVVSLGAASVRSAGDDALVVDSFDVLGLASAHAGRLVAGSGLFGGGLVGEDLDEEAIVLPG